MKLSRTVAYAVRATLQLAQSPSEAPVPCSKLAAEVKGDIQKLLAQWDLWGWHRVTFYGDLKEPVRQMADALKLRLVEEA